MLMDVSAPHERCTATAVFWARYPTFPAVRDFTPHGVTYLTTLPRSVLRRIFGSTDEGYRWRIPVRLPPLC